MTEVAHDDERFLRAYPAAVSAGRWEEVARLLSGKCRALEKKAAASNKANEALVAALEAARAIIVGFEPENGCIASDEEIGQIDAALALARGEV